MNFRRLFNITYFDDSKSAVNLYRRARYIQFFFIAISAALIVLWRIFIAAGQFEWGIVAGVLGTGLFLAWLIPLHELAEEEMQVIPFEQPKIEDLPQVNPIEAPDADDEDPYWWAKTELDALWRELLPTYGKGAYVYVIRDADVTGYCKIGRTNLPANRIGHFDITLPFRIEIVHLIPCVEDVKAETILHRRFAEQRVRGEWFDLTDKDIAWIISIGKL